MERDAPKLVSLFTGAGGLDIGLEAAGFDTVAATEIELYACQTLRANKELALLSLNEFADWFERQLAQKCYRSVEKTEADRLRRRLEPSVGQQRYLRNAAILQTDVRDLSSAELLRVAGASRGDLELVAGGPPCQPFSRAGKRTNVECDTGRLFKEFARIVDDLRPRWFLFENVKGLILTKADVLEIQCSNCGASTIAPFAARFGDFAGATPCPRCSSFQTRDVWRTERGGSLRIIVNEFERLGYKCYSRVLNAADFGAPQMRERLLIVGSRDGEYFEWPNATHCRITGSTSQPELFGPIDASARKPWNTMYASLWKHGHFKYGHLDQRRAVLWVKNVVRPHDEPVTWTLHRPAPTIGAHQAAKLAIAPNGVPPEQLARQQWHVKGRRQRDLPPVFVEHEYLSDEELLALQTFPSSWYLFGTRMQRAFQIGNAVPPILGEALGREILRTSDRASHTVVSNKVAS
jgi:DNA (cytosine-5)-methyltransferase 1